MATTTETSTKATATHTIHAPLPLTLATNMSQPVILLTFPSHETPATNFIAIPNNALRTEFLSLYAILYSHELIPTIPPLMLSYVRGWWNTFRNFTLLLLHLDEELLFPWVAAYVPIEGSAVLSHEGRHYMRRRLMRAFARVSRDWAGTVTEFRAAADSVVRILLPYMAEKEKVAAVMDKRIGGAEVERKIAEWVRAILARRNGTADVLLMTHWMRQRGLYKEWRGKYNLRPFRYSTWVQVGTYKDHVKLAAAFNQRRIRIEAQVLSQRVRHPDSNTPSQQEAPM